MRSPLEALFALAISLMNGIIEGILGAFGIAAKRTILPIEVRRGTSEEVIGVRHNVLRTGRPVDTAVFDGDSSPTTRHWVAQQADRIVGVASVMHTPDSEFGLYQLRGMAVLPELQRTGVGGAILQAVAAEVTEALWCNARIGVQAFYEENGWSPVGEPFEIEPIGPHIKMRRTI